MTGRITTAVASAVCFMLNATAQAAITPERISELHTLSWQQHSIFREANPATMLLLDSLSISSAAMGGDWSLSGTPYRVEEGRGETRLSLSAASYQHLSSGNAVWGEAGFSTANVRDVKWCDCLEYERVAPYILGDEVGGNLSTRRYSFAGGYAFHTRAWLLGLSGAYRAEIGYRNCDPRLKSIVSDLSLALGAARYINRGYTLGVSAAFNLYRQNCDIDFYNPLNDINTYTLTGLGSYYPRFMGNTNKNSGYESTGGSFSLQWQPVGSEGFYALTSFRFYKMEQRLRNYNNLTLGYTSNSSIHISAAYGLRLDKLRMSPGLSATFFNRKGTENIFGSAEGASFDPIGTRSPYRRRFSTLRLSVPVEYSLGSSLFSLLAEVAYTNDAETLNQPVRKVSADKLSPALTIGFTRRFGEKWLMESSLGAEWSQPLSETISLSDLADDSLGDAVRSNAAMLTSRHVGAEMKLGITRFLRKGIAISLAAYAGTVRYKALSTERRAGVSVGVIF